MDGQERFEKKLKIRAYVFAASLALMLATVMFFTIEKPFGVGADAAAVLGALSNSFTVPGALLGGFGGLSFMAKLGAYDGLVYSFKNFGLHTLIGGNPNKKKTQTFYEYKTAKDEKGRKWFPNFLWVGVASLVIGIILAIVAELL